MSLESKDVKKIAHLARIQVGEDDIPSLTKDLSGILNLVEQMNQADTKDVTPLAHPYDERQPLRKDVVTEPNQRDLFQSNAPETQSGLFVVPQVIEDA